MPLNPHSPYSPYSPYSPILKKVKEKFFHQILDILFLTEYLLIFREEPEMFNWKETELAGRNKVMKKCYNLKGGSSPLVLDENAKK
jgi:hypothetical protein